MHVLILSVLITVSAQGRASAPPDMATEAFTIATNADAAAAAASDNNARFSRLQRALQGLGIAPGDIRTTSYNISFTPPAPQTPGVPVQRSGYFVNRSIEVTLRRLENVGKAIDTAVASGVTDIGGVSFGVRDDRKQYAQALTSAIRDARSQADAMATAAGLHIYAIKSMQQGFAELPTPRIVMAAALPAPAPPTTIEPSNVQVSASVTVSYEAR